MSSDPPRRTDDAPLDPPRRSDAALPDPPRRSGSAPPDLLRQSGPLALGPLRRTCSGPLDPPRRSFGPRKVLPLAVASYATWHLGRRLTKPFYGPTVAAGPWWGGRCYVTSKSTHWLDLTDTREGGGLCGDSRKLQELWFAIAERFLTSTTTAELPDQGTFYDQMVQRTVEGSLAAQWPSSMPLLHQQRRRSRYCPPVRWPLGSTTRGKALRRCWRRSRS